MASRQKGNRSENRAVNELKRNGWLIYRVRGSSNMFQKSNDIFGLFDIVAKRNRETLWIQVKTNRKPPLRKYISFRERYCGISEQVQV